MMIMIDMPKSRNEIENRNKKIKIDMKLDTFKLRKSQVLLSIFLAQQFSVSFY